MCQISSNVLTMSLIFLWVTESCLVSEEDIPRVDFIFSCLFQDWTQYEYLVHSGPYKMQVKKNIRRIWRKCSSSLVSNVHSRVFFSGGLSKDKFCSKLKLNCLVNCGNYIWLVSVSLLLFEVIYFSVDGNTFLLNFFQNTVFKITNKQY